jgi:hypothetical protein
MDNTNPASNLEKKIENIENELREQNRNVLEHDTNDNEEKEIIIEDESAKPVTKNEQAKKLMESSIELISKADNEVEATKQSIIKDVNRFEELRNDILNNSIAKSQILLDKASYDYTETQPEEPFEISLDTTDEPIKVDKVSSGKFSGFILALLAMVATAIGWIYIASEKVGVKIEPPAIPDEASINKMLTWIGGGMTGAEGNPLFGIGTIALSALIIGVLVYKIRVSLKEHKNFKIASETFENSHVYFDRQKEKKTEMQKIDEHIKSLLPTLEDFKVLLDEQNGKLQRIVHVEGELEDSNEYHPSSIKEMQQSDRLMEQIEALINTPITKDGKLNQRAVELLEEAKRVYEYYISKIYS